jgi:hypothetical protein
MEDERATRMAVRADVRIEAMKMKDLAASIDLDGCGGINGDLRVVNSSGEFELKWVDQTNRRNSAVLICWFTDVQESSIYTVFLATKIE